MADEAKTNPTKENPDMIEGQAVMPGFNADPQPEQNPFVKKAVSLIWHNINIGQFNELKRAAQRGEFEQAFLSLIGEIAADIEKDPTAPPTDPASPYFDLEAFRQAILNAGGFSAVNACFDELVLDAAAEAEQYELSEEARESLAAFSATIKETAQAAVSNLSAFIHSEFYQELQHAVATVSGFIAEHKEELDALADIAADIHDLKPFLQMELEAAKNDPQLKDKTLKDLLRQGFSATGEVIESPFKQIIERAKKRKEEFDAAQDTLEEAQSLATTLQAIQGIRPESHTMPNNALMNALQTKAAINAGAFDLIVANEKGKRKQLTAYTMIELDPGETDISITGAHLTEYERQVSDAIVSLWIEAKKTDRPTVFTTDMIFRAMPGGGDRASAQQKGAITKTIEKFRRLHITVDATEEMRKRHIIGENATFRIDNFYLSATHAEYKIKRGGQTVNAYKIDAEPIILTYCKMTKQLLTVPASYIEIREVSKKTGQISPVALTMNANRQAMTGYILRRIAVMKRDRKNKKQTQSDIILFDAIFSDAGLAGQTKQSAANNRAFVFQVLDYQKAVGNIAGYETQRKGQSITGVKILLTPENLSPKLL